MNTITRGIPPPPASVGGTGTTAKQFGTTINIPGTSRLNGRTFRIVGSGSVTPGTTGNVSIQLTVSAPNGKYPSANITAADLTSNVATYVAKNNYVKGQQVVVAGCTTSGLNFTTAKAIASANGTQFTVAITAANIAAENEPVAALATIQPTTILAGATHSQAASAPFTFSAEVAMDSTSKLLQGTMKDSIDNTVVDAEAALAAEVAGIDPADEGWAVNASMTFGTSNANNAATLNKFDLEA